MSSKIKLQLYITPEQKRIIKMRSAKLGKKSMGDYIWDLVRKDLDLDELAEFDMQEKVR